MSSATNQLLALVAARFANLTAANGYTYVPRKIVRASLSAFSLQQDLPGLHYFSTGKNLAQSLTDTDTWDMDLVIEYYTKFPDSADSFLDIAAQLGDDVEAAVYRKPSAPALADDADPLLYNGSNVAVGEVTISTVEYAINKGQAPYCGAILTGRIRYITEKGTPATLLEF